MVFFDVVKRSRGGFQSGQVENRAESFFDVLMHWGEVSQVVSQVVFVVESPRAVAIIVFLKTRTARLARIMKAPTKVLTGSFSDSLGDRTFFLLPPRRPQNTCYV